MGIFFYRVFVIGSDVKTRRSVSIVHHTDIISALEKIVGHSLEVETRFCAGSCKLLVRIPPLQINGETQFSKYRLDLSNTTAALYDKTGTRLIGHVSVFNSIQCERVPDAVVLTFKYSTLPIDFDSRRSRDTPAIHDIRCAFVYNNKVDHSM